MQGGLHAFGRALSGNRGFAGLLASTFALGLAFSFVVPFLSVWGIEHIGMSPFEFGLFMTATSLSGALINTALARWSDVRVARRTMLLVGATGGVLGYAGYGLVREPLALVAIGTTCVAVASICFAQLFAHARETFANTSNPAMDAGLLVSVVRVCFSFAWTAGPAIGAAMMLQFGFRGLFSGAAGLYLVFLFGVLIFVPGRRPSIALPAQKKHPPVWRVLTRRDVLSCFIAFTAVLAAHAINMMNLPLALTRALGGSEREVGIAFGIGPLVEIPLMLWFGHLAARGHQLRLIRIGAVVTLLYFLGLSLAREPWHVYPVQILSGVSFAILTNVAILFFQDLLPGQTGLATAVFANAGSVGNLIGYTSFGMLTATIGHHDVFLVCAALSAVTSILLLRYRPRPVLAS